MKTAVRPVLDFSLGQRYAPQRSVQEQLDALTKDQQASFVALKQELAKEKFDDYMLLRLLRASPGETKFNVKTATSVGKKLAVWSKKIHLKQLSIQHVRAQLETGCLIWTGSVNVDGHALLYMKPSLYSPGKDSLDSLIRSLVYLLQIMSEDEQTATLGLAFVANMQDWGWSNFGVQYAKAFFDTLQGRFPCRVRQFIIYKYPSWFGAIWNVIRPMMSKEFAQKVVFVQPDTIATYFPSDQYMPDALGGKLNLKAQLSGFIRSQYAIEKLDYAAPYPLVHSESNIWPTANKDNDSDDDS